MVGKKEVKTGLCLSVSVNILKPHYMVYNYNYHPLLLCNLMAHVQ